MLKRRSKIFSKDLATDMLSYFSETNPIAHPREKRCSENVNRVVHVLDEKAARNDDDRTEKKYFHFFLWRSEKEEK